MSHSRIDELKIRAKILVKESKKSGKPISLGEALDSLAQKLGHASWRDLRESENNDIFYPPYASSRLNHWFRSYDEAQKFLEQNQDYYLLPYRRHFFACTQDYLEGTLGLSPDDTDVKAIGQNWARPHDQSALNNARTKIKEFLKAREEKL